MAVPAGARETQSAALEGDAAHLRTDAYTSAGVLVGLALVQITGAEWLDPVVALVIAGAIVVTGLRIVVRSWGVLVDEALPDHELDAIRETIEGSPAAASSATTSCAPAAPAPAATSTCTCSSSRGTSLEDAHGTAHALQDEIARRLPGGTDVLIHLEPADKVRPGRGNVNCGIKGVGSAESAVTVLEGQAPSACDRPHPSLPPSRVRPQRRLIAAASATANTTPA